MTNPIFSLSSVVSNEQLNALFAAAWANYHPRDFQPVLRHSLLYVCAHMDEHLIGYVNVAWDGGVHAFLLDTTVHSEYQGQGIGVRLVKLAIEATAQRGIEWLHVDYEPHLRTFYQRCGFHPTEAGLIRLQTPAENIG